MRNSFSNFVFRYGDSHVCWMFAGQFCWTKWDQIQHAKHRYVNKSRSRRTRNFAMIHFYFSQRTMSTMNLSCSAMCECDKSKFSPVCGSDGLTYFSSCQAGCRSLHFEDGKTQFSNCECIPQSERPFIDPFPTPNSTDLHFFCIQFQISWKKPKQLVASVMEIVKISCCSSRYFHFSYSFIRHPKWAACC